MGRASSLPLTHLLWVNNVMIEYIGKLEAHARNEVSESDVSAWVADRRNGYESKFGAEIASGGLDLVALRKVRLH